MSNDLFLLPQPSSKASNAEIKFQAQKKVALGPLVAEAPVVAPAEAWGLRAQQLLLAVGEAAAGPVVALPWDEDQTSGFAYEPCFQGRDRKKAQKKELWVARFRRKPKGFSGKIACFTHRETAARATQIDTIASCTER